jgi:hypothetical protein
MKVILSVPDEGYSRTYLMKVILGVPDEGYSRNVSCALNVIFTFLFNQQLTKLVQSWGKGASRVCLVQLNGHFEN